MMADTSSNSLLEASAASCNKSDTPSEVAVSAPANTLFAQAISGGVGDVAADGTSASDALARTKFGNEQLLSTKGPLIRGVDLYISPALEAEW